MIFWMGNFIHMMKTYIAHLFTMGMWHWISGYISLIKDWVLEFISLFMNWWLDNMYYSWRVETPPYFCCILRDKDIIYSYICKMMKLFMIYNEWSSEISIWICDVDFFPCQNTSFWTFSSCWWYVWPSWDSGTYVVAILRWIYPQYLSGMHMWIHSVESGYMI